MDLSIYWSIHLDIIITCLIQSKITSNFIKCELGSNCPTQCSKIPRNPYILLWVSLFLLKELELPKNLFKIIIELNKI